MNLKIFRTLLLVPLAWLPVQTHAQTNPGYQKLADILAPINSVRSETMKKWEEASPEMKKDSSFIKSVSITMKDLHQQERKAYEDFLHQNPDNDSCITVLKKIAGSKSRYPATSDLYNSLSERVKNSIAGKKYGADLAAELGYLAETSVGKPAPEFTQNDVNGKPVSLKDFRGKYVLLDFWASWCGPCRAENPNVVKNYQKFKDKNFTVLGVSLDRQQGRDAWLKAIASDQLEWTQVSDLNFWNNAVARQYHVRAIPQNFLIGPDGRILAKDLRGEELGQKLSELLN